MFAFDLADNLFAVGFSVKTQLKLINVRQKKLFTKTSGTGLFFIIPNDKLDDNSEQSRNINLSNIFNSLINGSGWCQI